MERNYPEFNHELHGDAQYQANQGGNYNAPYYEGVNTENAQNAETIDLAEQSQTKLPTSGAQKNKVIGFVSDLGHTLASEMNNFGKTVSNKTAGKGAKQVSKEIASETLDTVKYIWKDAKKAFSDLKGMFRRSKTTDTNNNGFGDEVTLDGPGQTQVLYTENAGQASLNMGGSMQAPIRPNPFQIAKQKTESQYLPPQ